MMHGPPFLQQNTTSAKRKKLKKALQYAGGGASAGLAPYRQSFAGPDPFPSMATVKLRFTYKLTVTGNATASLIGPATPYLLQLNSINEPLDTAAAQPYGHDQMAALYGRYKVKSVQVAFLHGCTTGNLLVIATQPPEGGQTIGGADGGLIAARPNVAIVPSPVLAYQKPEIWRRTYKISELLGLTDAEYDANVEEYSAAVGANPTRMPTVEIGTFGLTIGSGAVSLLLTCIYDVQFFGRVGQANS